MASRAPIDDVPRRGDTSLTRKESKAITRGRLLEAALRILDEEGESALTTTSVTRAAGIAQSSFYVHFADMDDLLHSLIDELTIEWRRQTRDARKMLRAAPLDPDRFRATFRIPMQHSIDHPQLFRLLNRSRGDRTSPLGDWSRSVFESNRAGLVEDLVASGFPATTPAERQAAEMVADGIIGMTTELTFGYLDGRYQDLEEVLDILVAFSLGYFTLYRPETDPGEVVSVAAKALARRGPSKPRR